MDMLHTYDVTLNAHDTRRKTFRVIAADSYLAKCEAYRCIRGIPAKKADMAFPPLHMNPQAKRV